MQMYMKAADVLKMLEKGKNLKNVCFNADLGKLLGPIYKMNLKISENKQILEDILAIYSKEGTVRNRELMLILIYELFLGAGKIKGGGALKRTLMVKKEAVEKKFGATLVKLREECNKEENARIV